ncbi:MAG: Heavy metal transport/detoxification protein [Candidatus Magasanikbacteria bacterium GW2011_GWA2_45_39]|uniref:Heavy metal transport/detoxification protein n=2 Tax=Candidatus Magasanikiibacteriota TaxID=1752731 RepID=A0A0G1MZ76_9BACT|nr:MAG: Heavy metal transport/detoxification protein [Candidatus Magasanikbacteria bacterium GW2011_GWA2_45_39]KKU13661.1 MAG: Heavy metal transport/detoxification protein [Candidatus Magasanikbacteria bacterium GW2011_GWC2_45_8]
MHVIKVYVKSAENSWPRTVKETLMRQENVVQVDINEVRHKARVVVKGGVNIELLNSALKEQGIELSVYEVSEVELGERESFSGIDVATSSVVSRHATLPLSSGVPCGELMLGIDGMTCRSCEITIESKFKKIEGVVKVNVNASKGEARVVYNTTQAPSLDRLQSAIAREGYKVRSSAGQNIHTKRVDTDMSSVRNQKLTFSQLVGVFAIVLGVLWILSKVGLFKTGFVIGQNTGFWTIFVIGLIAASSSCIAVSGGLLLSSAARFHERYGASGLGRMYPVYMFVIGRTVSYGVLGGLIGFLGKSLSLPQWLMGTIALIAAVYMLIMGLEMLNIAPSWLRGILPNMASKDLSHKVLDAGQKSEHPLAPFMLGAATFFLPCGFTQALQLYALTTGSIATSALLLFGFALGTVPALLALGWASSSLKGKAGRLFFQFAGALVVVLGFYNIQNGLTILGYPLPAFSINSSAVAANTGSGNTGGKSNVTVEGGKQVMKMTVDSYGYTPDEFTVRAGVPVKWEIDGTNAAGCASVLQARDFGLRAMIAGKSDNVLEFTPDKPGRYLFSCSMGMYRGYINVVSKT